MSKFHVIPARNLILQSKKVCHNITVSTESQLWQLITALKINRQIQNEEKITWNWDIIYVMKICTEISYSFKL